MSTEGKQRLTSECAQSLEQWYGIYIDGGAQPTPRQVVTLTMLTDIRARASKGESATAYAASLTPKRPRQILKVTMH